MKIKRQGFKNRLKSFARYEGLLSKTSKILFVFVITVLVSTSNGGCMSMNATNKEKKDFIRSISFSPDGKKLIFSRIRTGELHRIQVYNMETGDLAVYQPPEGERWIQAKCSFDGKRIVFIAMPLIGNKEDIENAQIAIMDVNGKNIRKITKTPGLKIYPSFSHSGKKIIYARPDAIRKSGRTPAADYDLYEVDVETSREIRLTHFEFFEISAPYYFPDDKTFIFWGDPPGVYPAVPESKNIYVMNKIRKDLRAKYKYHNIYVMQANEKELKPYLVIPDHKKKYNGSGSEYTRRPALSADGSVLIFMSIGYRLDNSAEGWQFYQYSGDGNHRQITHLNEIVEATVDTKGERLVVVHESKQNINNIVIYKVKDGTSQKITLPDQPTHIINIR